MKANLKFWFSSIATILIGVLFFMRGAGALDLMVKVFAGILAVSGIISFITLAWLRGIVKLVLGVALWIIDWQSYARIALYIVGSIGKGREDKHFLVALVDGTLELLA